MDKELSVKLQSIVQVAERFRAAVNRSVDQFIEDLAAEVKDEVSDDGVH